MKTWGQVLHFCLRNLARLTRDSHQKTISQRGPIDIDFSLFWEKPLLVETSLSFSFLFAGNGSRKAEIGSESGDRAQSGTQAGFSEGIKSHRRLATSKTSPKQEQVPEQRGITTRREGVENYSWKRYMRPIPDSLEAGVLHSFPAPFCVSAERDFLSLFTLYLTHSRVEQKGGESTIISLFSFVSNGHAANFSQSPANHSLLSSALRIISTDS